MKLFAMVQMYNELESGNLQRCMMSLSRYCDGVQIYNDGSTDGSLEYIQDHWSNDDSFTVDIINSQSNDFKNELAHKQAQVDRCKELGADWIIRMDCDEVVEPRGEDGEIRRLCEDNAHKSYAFKIINLWRSEAWHRIDSGFNSVIFNRLWRVPGGGLKFNVQKGLHLTNYPVGATDNEGFSNLKILHYGFSSDKSIIDKYRMYKGHGQSGNALHRLVDETTLRVTPSDPTWFRGNLPTASKKDTFATPIRSMV